MLSSSKYLVLSFAGTLSGVTFAQAPAPAAAPATTTAAAPAAAPTAATTAAPPPVAEPAPAPATEPAPAAEAPPPVEEPAPAAPPPVSEPAPAEPADGAAGGRPPITKQSSLYLGVPIWMSNAPLDPGFEFELRGGLKIGVLVPELGLGMRWNWANVDKIEQNFPDVAAPQLYAGENLQGMWFSLGLRVEPTMKTDKIQPYFSGAFDMILWGTSFNTTEFCGFWTCSTVRQFEFAPGFSGRAGIRITPKPFIGIDLGAKIGMSFPGWAFQDTQSYITPYAGLTFIVGAGRK
jgi:hypothetical protein